MLSTRHGWDWFKERVREATGLDLTQYKAGQMDRRLGAMAERAGARTPQQFWEWLKAGPDRMRPFLDRVSINVSELLRNPEKFEQLRERILPELLAKHPSLRVWSAGCSYGAEAYSVAMLLRERAPDGRHSILGTDIDHAILERAAHPKFSAQDMKNVSHWRKRVFFDESGGEFGPKEPLRQIVQVKKHDLLRDVFPTDFDLILCRNVVIYFTDEAKERLYREFRGSLRHGGVLFVGSTERIMQSKELGFESPLPFFYRRPISEGTQWQRAS